VPVHPKSRPSRWAAEAPSSGFARDYLPRMVSARWVMRFDLKMKEKPMLGKKSRWIAPLAATAAVLLAASPASAAPDDIVVARVSAENSCTSFGIALTYNQGTIRERKFANGNIYQVGTGRTITWSNETNKKTYTVKTSGSVAKYVLNPDGKAYTLTLTGHNAFVYFLGDEPLGPGAYQYTGRVVLQVDSDLKVYSVDATAGKVVDICKLLT
jgi:hypothetical protein